jgi:hypothetical protein
VRLPALLRSAPTLSDVERALLGEVSSYSDGTRHVPNAWGVHLSRRDARKAAPHFPAWSSTLSERVLGEQRRLGLPTTGMVTVSFNEAPDLQPGQFRVSGAVRPGEATVLERPDLLPGRPRLVLAAGGTARHGTPTAAGIDREVMLPPGAFVVGRDKDADLRVHDAAMSPRHIELTVTADRVRVRDLGSLNGTLVDGVPSVAVDLVDGNRIEIGTTTLVFHRDDDQDEGGREGGEGE